MSGVCWHRLQLSGFGVHDNLELGLNEGLVVFVARNERGKSTAVAGLTAVLFGLPVSKDRAVWGQARFRSHHGGSRFEGTVEFSARDGQSYRLWRNFDTQMVRLSRKAARGYEVIFEGEHKPNARRGAMRYEEYLDALLGMTSHELFSSTFSVQQPLAGGHQLSQEVSALLAGSGGGSHQSALEGLEREITQRTKYTRQYGLLGSNKSKNRDLEEIEERVQEIRTAVREGGAAADALQGVQKKLAGAVEEEGTLKVQVERAATKALAAKAWVEAKDRHDREQRTYTSLKRKLNEARRLEERIAEAAPATSERPERT